MAYFAVVHGIATMYIFPLGGNRCKLRRGVLSLFAVWALTGLWHGANFNFIAWESYYFVILVLEKYVYGKYLEKLPSLLNTYTHCF